jgi:uridine phosphorylase
MLQLTNYIGYKMYKQADLPLNSRGAVYHLDLLPEELADTIITVGDPGRVQQISNKFDSIEITRAHREFVTHTGYLGKKRISVISTGIGMPNIDIVMNELDALVNIDLTTLTSKKKQHVLKIIRLGTAGSLQSSCNVGDIIVSRYAVSFDGLLGYYQYQTPSKLKKMLSNLRDHTNGSCGQIYLSEADLELFNQFSSIGIAGITATCSGFYGPQGRQLRVALAYPDLLDKLVTFDFYSYKIFNFEMETAGILGLGKLFGHQCLSISVVIANRITGEFSEVITDKVEDLIDKALQLI